MTAVKAELVAMQQVKKVDFVSPDEALLGSGLTLRRFRRV